MENTSAINRRRDLKYLAFIFTLLFLFLFQCTYSIYDQRKKTQRCFYYYYYYLKQILGFSIWIFMRLLEHFRQ